MVSVTISCILIQPIDLNIWAWHEPDTDFAVSKLCKMINPVHARQPDHCLKPQSAAVLAPMLVFPTADKLL